MGITLRPLLAEVIIDELQIDWYTDFYFPFIARWSQRLRKTVGDDKLLFAEPIPNEVC